MRSRKIYVHVSKGGGNSGLVETSSSTLPLSGSLTGQMEFNYKNTSSLTKLRAVACSRLTALLLA